MENYDCIVHGKLTGSYCLVPYWVRFSEFSPELYIYNYMDRWPIRKFIKIGLDSEYIFGYVMDLWYEPYSNVPASGIITTIGSEGTLNWSGNFYGNISVYHKGFWTFPYGERQDWYFFKGITGFTGIRIFLKGTCYFFGYAEKVKISSSTPPH